MQDSALDYENHALEFLRSRDTSSIGADRVRLWSQSLPTGASVLELACGGGYPITRQLQAAGLQIQAIDSSPTLVAKFQSRFPEIPVECARVQDSLFFQKKFDAVVAIGLLFLLEEDQQRELILKVSRCLLPGGRFLFTAPLETGKWKDMITRTLSHSPGQRAYTQYLEMAGLRIIETYSDAGANNYYDTIKQPD